MQFNFSSTFGSFESVGSRRLKFLAIGFLLLLANSSYLAAFDAPTVFYILNLGMHDNDGDPDVLVTTNGGPAYLLRNDGGNQLRSARFKLQGTASNRDGLGAKLTLTLADGSKQWQMVHSGSSYCSQSELVLTFGLGRNDKIERAEIEWPNGKVEKLTSLPPNQLFLVKEGGGLAESRPLPMATPTPAPSPSATVAGR